MREYSLTVQWLLAKARIYGWGGTFEGLFFHLLKAALVRVAALLLVFSLGTKLLWYGSVRGTHRLGKYRYAEVFVTLLVFLL